MQKTKLLLLLLLLSFAFRLPYFLALRPWEEEKAWKTITRLDPDSVQYDRSARYIARTGHYPPNEVYRTPGYPYFLGFFYWLFQRRILPVVIAQLILGLATCAIIFYLTFSLSGSAWASFWAGLGFGGTSRSLAMPG